MANELEIRIGSRDSSGPGFASAQANEAKLTAAMLAARKAALSAAEAADKVTAARAAQAAVAARVASEELDEAEALRLTTKAARDLERAQIELSIAHRAAAAAADHQAEQERELGRASRGAADDARRGFALFRDLGTSATESVSKGLAKLDEMGPVAVGGIALAIAALPALSIAAGGAITLGLGGGLAAMAIMAASKSAQVKKEFTDLKDHVGHELTDMAKPFEPTLIHIADLSKSAFDELEPSLTRSLKSMAPAFDDFATKFIQSTGRFGPTIEKVGEEFDLLLGAIGDRAPAIVDNLAEGIEGLVGAVEGHEDDFAGFVEGLTEIIAVGGKAADFLADTYDIVAGAKALAGVWGMVKDAVSGSSDGWSETSEASWEAQKSISASGEAMDLAKTSAEALTTALEELSGGQLNERAAARDFQEAIDAMGASLKKNGHTFDINTEKGRANQAALDRIASTGIKLSESLQQVDKTGKKSAESMNRTRAAFIAAAEAGGKSHAAAVRLADSMGLVATKAGKIPSKTETKVLGTIRDLESKIATAKAKLKTVPPSKRSAIQGNIADLQRKVAAAKAQLASIHDKTVYVTTIGQKFDVSTHAAVGRAHGGISGGLATGGNARGSSTASGSVLALVGEAGREIVRLPYGSTVYPHGQTEMMIESGEFDPEAYATGGNTRAKSPWGKASAKPSPWGHATYDPWGHGSINPKPKAPVVKPNTGAVAPHVPFWWHGGATTSFGPGQAHFSWGGPRPDDVPYVAPPPLKVATSKDDGWGKAEIQGWVKDAIATHRPSIEIKSDGSAHSDYLVAELRKAVRSRGGDVQIVLGK